MQHWGDAEVLAQARHRPHTRDELAPELLRGQDADADDHGGAHEAQEREVGAQALGAGHALRAEGRPTSHQHTAEDAHDDVLLEALGCLFRVVAGGVRSRLPGGVGGALRIGHGVFALPGLRPALLQLRVSARVRENAEECKEDAWEEELGVPSLVHDVGEHGAQDEARPDAQREGDGEPRQGDARRQEEVRHAEDGSRCDGVQHQGPVDLGAAHDPRARCEQEDHGGEHGPQAEVRVVVREVDPVTGGLRRV
mmetsp:Transcript_65293/g.182629  ORF Transcript_65293/g.182629 Transcript_65293/m.182629 type:complete len:253 (-) Transcript_65293:190-948(-)